MRRNVHIVYVFYVDYRKITLHSHLCSLFTEVSLVIESGVRLRYHASLFFVGGEELYFIRYSRLPVVAHLSIRRFDETKSVYPCESAER